MTTLPGNTQKKQRTEVQYCTDSLGGSRVCGKQEVKN